VRWAGGMGEDKVEREGEEKIKIKVVWTFYIF
jgi:hypothetical protein